MESHYRSALLRGYDLSLPHNRAILLLSAAGAVVAAAVRLLQGPPVWGGAVRAAVGAVVVFAAAAVAKEIDPDEPRTAVLSAGLAISGAWLAPLLALPAIFWLLGCLRLVNRSTGLPPTTWDILVLLAASALLTWLRGPVFGILTGGVLILEALLPEGRRANAGLGAAVLAIAAGYLALNRERAVPVAMERWLVAAMLIAAVAFIPFILNSYQVAAVGDVTGRKLDASRVQAGQAVALGMGLSLASWHGMPGATLLIALWAALLAALGYYLLITRARRSAAPL